MDNVSPPSRCPRCGASLASDDLDGLCGTCLMAAGTASPSQPGGSMSGFSSLDGSDANPSTAARLPPGQIFGRYRIERLIGRGGMGEVYAAEQVDSGRRVALKVINERLGDPQDRARFLREGQLAASISHPNSVYIFGSEEVDGVPVITMELLPGGTLKDRVKSQGPLSPADAVDAILQILAGLDAAQAAGILHRDVKPGNCFTDTDGTLKIGDFGLSISTLARDVTHSAAHGGFRGTPQFASPEQLRGAPLDVRADIYAAGATLFYLLTGQPPFDERELVALVTRVSSEAPRSPRDLQPHIPRSLARVVQRCLSKDPAARPASYADLTAMLRPYASRGSAPAALGARFVAAVVDSALLTLTHAGALSAVILWRNPLGWISAVPPAPPWWSFLLLSVAYFTVLEGFWGVTIGKRICGLRVVRVDGSRRVGLRALARAGLYQLPAVLWHLPILQDRMTVLTWTNAILQVAPLLMTAAMFLTARRHNGFAALHDLVTNTRVVVWTGVVKETTLKPSMPSVAAAPELAQRRGPFEIVGAIGSTDIGRLLLAFDPALRRNVWIHDVPIATPPVPAERRDIGRPGRLRWLAGARTEAEAWDAYEALDGAPLADRLDGPLSSWGVVNRWLQSLSTEMAASDPGTGPLPLTRRRVWITSDNAAKVHDFELLDWPGHRAAREPDLPEVQEPQRFLAWVGASALGQAGDPEYWPAHRPIPLSARSLLDRLAQNAFPTMKDVATECRRMLSVPDHVTRLRRSAHLGFTSLTVICALLMGAIAAPLINEAENAGINDLQRFLHVINLRDQDPYKTLLTPVEHEALEVYVAGRYGTMLADERFWDSTFANLLQPHREMVTRLLAQHPRVSEAELDAAKVTLKTFLARHEDNGDVSFAWWEVVVTIAAFALMMLVLPAVLSALVTPGGIVLSVMGMAIVDRAGREVSRARSLWRAIVAWSPILLLLAFHVAYYASLLTFSQETDFSESLAFWLMDYVSTEQASLVALVVLAVGSAIAALSPERGIQDRLAGTWLVPK